MSQNKGQYEFDALTVEKTFESFYIVPDYQREYVWKADEHVAKLLMDLYEAYSTDPNKEYFVGTTVVFENGSMLELIDGQQRTTTLFLMLCAFRRIYKERNLPTAVLDKKIADVYMDENGDEQNAYRLTLQYENATAILKNIAEGNELDSKKISGSNLRLIEAYNIIYDFINNQTINDDAELKAFYMYFYKKLKYIQIKTPDINDALKIFETINARGAGLNSMDLLKNLIFRQVPRDKFDILKQRWQEFISILEKANEKPLRFLRYFIVSNYPSIDNSPDKQENVMREDNIYNWMHDNASKCGYNKDPFGFVQLLTENAQCYANFAKGKDASGNDNPYLKNIILLGGSAFRQHLILLLTARHFSLDMFNYLAKNLETYLFYYLFTREQAKIYEKQFGKWNMTLKDVKSMSDLVNFVQAQMKPEITKKDLEFKGRFETFSENDLQVYRVRYILAKLSQYIDQSRINAIQPCSIDSYIKDYEIEHILPQKPQPDMLAHYEELGIDYKQLRSMLGNLTLLEQPINGSIHNDDFSTKVQAYAASKTYLTSSLNGLDKVGVNTAITRTNAMLKEFDHWDQDTIAERQKMLYDIALKIWNMD